MRSAASSGRDPPRRPNQVGTARASNESIYWTHRQWCLRSMSPKRTEQSPSSQKTAFSSGWCDWKARESVAGRRRAERLPRRHWVAGVRNAPSRAPSGASSRVRQPHQHLVGNRRRETMARPKRGRRASSSGCRPLRARGTKAATECVGGVQTSQSLHKMIRHISTETCENARARLDALFLRNAAGRSGDVHAHEHLLCRTRTTRSGARIKMGTYIVVAWLLDC